MDLVDLTRASTGFNFSAQDALVELAAGLEAAGYDFVTPTPETVRRVNARPTSAEAYDLRGVFGWSRPFSAELLPRAMLNCLERANALHEVRNLKRSAVRYSRLGRALFVHSSAPTDAHDSVFFGPDTYRFARLIAGVLGPQDHIRRIADVGCGSGAGGVTAWQALGSVQSTSVVLADINVSALNAAAVNVQTAGLKASTLVSGDLLNSVEGSFDLIVSNPPYLLDNGKRVYRHGGGALGEALSLRILSEGAARLNPGGRLILYTGSAVVDGRDQFRAAAADLLAEMSVQWDYAEIDPDVFGEELTEVHYAHADRIAAVGLVVRAI
jgi:methylase of polypeptide subunit release factors